MKADVYIELPSSKGSPLRIATRKDASVQEIAPETFRGNAQTKAVAFAPALAVARFQIPVAARSESEARRAALYALEDEIAQPIEDVHLTLGPRSRGDASRVVFVVDKSLFEYWTGLLRSHGLSHAPIVPESSLDQAQPTVYRFEDRWLLAGPGRIFGADGALPDEAVEALIDAAGLTGARTVHRGSFAFLTEAYQKHAGLTLANSGKSTEATRQASGFGFWRLAASLALAAIVLWVGSLWTETSRLERSAAINDAAARSAFRAQFPGAPEPADVHQDVRRQMERSLSSGNGSFRAMASDLYKAIAESDSVQLARMSFAQNDPGLRASLIFADRQSEQAFRASLEASGLDVELVSAADTPQGVQTDIMLRARP